MSAVHNDRTYVVGFWPIRANVKNSLQHYQHYLSLTLRMLAGSNVIVVSDHEGLLRSVREVSRRIGFRFQPIRRSIAQLDKFADMTTVLERTLNYGLANPARPADGFDRDKGLAHYWRDLRDSDEATFRQVFAIWHSKVDLLHEMAQRNPFGTGEFAWIDASVSRFNQQRPAWDFTQVEALRGNVIQHYGNRMRKQGRELLINASLLLGSARGVARLKQDYDAAFVEHLTEDYPNDEEIVLDALVRQNPAHFAMIGPETSSSAANGRSPAGAVSVRAGDVTSQPATVSSRRRKVLVVGTFRSGTNAAKATIEQYFRADVVFSEWFWKHGVPPTLIQQPVPGDVPIVVMIRHPFAFNESLYRFYRARRPELDLGRSVAEFIRKPLIVYDNEGGGVHPRYRFASPTEYWNQFYYTWLHWKAVDAQRVFLRCEDLVGDAEAHLAPLITRLGIGRFDDARVVAPQERLGPSVDQAMPDGSDRLGAEDRRWIASVVDRHLVDRFGYVLS